MALLHGGTPTGAERIAACWADSRKVPQIVFDDPATIDANYLRRTDAEIFAKPVAAAPHLAAPHPGTPSR